MKPLHWITVVIAFGLATWFIYRTRESQPRIDEVIDLNWRFVLDDPEYAHLPEFDDSDWRYISLPHDWMIEQPVKPGNPSGTAGGFYPEGVAWYRKNLDLSQYRKYEQFYLMFEGVQMNADVYFNGTHLGKQIYGYSSFYHDISGLIRTDTLNVIAVRTDCSHLPVDRWYSGGGIYRHVHLVAASELHIPIWGSAVTSVIDSSGAAELSIALEILNNSNKAHRFEVQYDVVDPDGHIVAQGTTIEFLEPGTEGKARQAFRIEDPRLWSPDQPSLYEVNCYLRDRNSRIDHIRTAHGIRTVEFNPDRGFLLNGKKVVMKGVCLHHDGGELGAAVPVESWSRRLTLLKELGVNAIRFAHNPHATEVLDLCDQMGFLVIDEMYDKWEESWHGNDDLVRFSETWEKDLTNFIRRDRNHPSVVLWSVGNETMEQLNDPVAGIYWYNTLKDLVESIDPSRMVTAAMHPGTAEDGHQVPSAMMHVSPVVSYNYRTDSFRTWHQQYPELVFIATETKAYGTQRKEDYQVIDFSDNSWNEEVVVFTTCDNVELRLNDRVIDNLDRNRYSDGVIKITVPYEKGELVAHAYYPDENGELQTVSDTLTSARNPYTLAMQADRDEIGPGSREVVHITTSVVDSSGVLNPHSAHMVNYQVDGPGEIRVIDNGDLADQTPYGSSSRKVRQGKQLLILQAGTEPGDLIVNASAEGLQPSKVKIKSKD